MTRLHADDDAADLGQHPVAEPADAVGRLADGLAVGLRGNVRRDDGGRAVVGHESFRES